MSREYKASLPLLLAGVCPVKAGVVRWLQINIAAKHELTRHGVSHSYSHSHSHGHSYSYSPALLCSEL